jgi:ketosteroid isomerase-like protein
MAALATPSVHAQQRAPVCPETGPGSPDALSRNWILVGWDRKETDGRFVFREKLGQYYDWSASGSMMYDDVDPQRRVVRTPEAYGAIWEPLFNEMRSAEHRLSIPPQVLISGELAMVNLQFVAKLSALSGSVTGIRTYTSLAWRCTGEGWKIVREHNSSTILAPEAIDPAMAAAEPN